MTRELCVLLPAPTHGRTHPRPRRQPPAPHLAGPRAEALLREMAFVLKATRMVRESMGAAKGETHETR